VVNPFQESERFTDVLGTDRRLRPGRNSSDILSGSDSVVNGFPAYIDVEEDREKPEQPVDFGE
jgi:hypothetical protein